MLIQCKATAERINGSEVGTLNGSTAKCLQHLCYPGNLYFGSPFHTGFENAKLPAILLILLASSVNTPICNSRFHLLACGPRVLCGLGLTVFCTVGQLTPHEYVGRNTACLPVMQSESVLINAVSVGRMVHGMHAGHHPFPLLCLSSCFSLQFCHRTNRCQKTTATAE